MGKLLKLSSIRTDSRTKQIFCSMNTRFVPRNYKDKNGEFLLYLTITSRGKQKKLSLDLTVKEGEFNLKTQKIIGKDKRHKDLQLILDNIVSKITNIKTEFRLMDKILTIEKLVEEIQNNVPRRKEFRPEKTVVYLF